MKLSTGTLFDLRVGERGLVGMMFAYNFALLLALYLLKPARDSLFLIEIGPTELPFVFLAVAVAVVPVTILYGRLGRRMRLSALVNSTTLVLVGSLVAMRWVLDLDASWVFFLLYVWVSIYSVLATSQYWLLAGSVFDPAQAKRVFALLSLGAILGAIVGGELTGFLIEEVGMRTRNLLWIAAGVLAGTAVLVNLIRMRADTSTSVQPDEPNTDEPVLSVLAGSRHLRLITAVIAIAVLTTALVDFQFKTVSADAFPVKSDLTAFIGRFYGRVSLIALALQFFVAPRILRVRGIGGAILLLPVALVIGSAAMFVLPGLLTGTLLRGADQSLKHSIDRTGRELLFLPVPLAAKKQVKVFIDVFVDQGMQGLAGLLLLGALALGLTVKSLSLVVLALLTVWIGLAVWARLSYIQAFRETLPNQNPEGTRNGGRGRSDDEPLPTLPDVPSLIDDLKDTRTGTVLEALDTLDEADVDLPSEQASDLLQSRSARVRRRTIALLAKQREEGFSGAVADFLRDRDAEVRLEAARFLYQTLEEDRLELFEAGLCHEDLRIRAAVVSVVAESDDPDERALITDGMLRSLLDPEGSTDVEVRVEALRALGKLNRPAFYDTVRNALDEEAPQIVHAAIRAAGHTADRRFVGKLLRLLAEKPYEKAAREALVSYGDRIFGTLYDYLTDDTVDEPIRRNIPRMLAELPSQPVADLLLLSLERLRAPLLYDVAKALNKIRANAPTLRFNQEALDVAVHGEIRALATVQAVLYHHRRSPDPLAQGPGREKVRTALIRERMQSLERVFRMLGLRYPSADMHSAYLGLTENDELRASAAEFLDSVLDWDFKRYLVPLLDESPDMGDVHVAEGMAGKPFPTWQAALRDLLLYRHPRPLACALAAVPDALPSDLAEIALAACTPDPSDDPPEMHDEAPAPFRPSTEAAGDGASTATNPARS